MGFELFDGCLISSAVPDGPEGLCDRGLVFTGRDASRKLHTSDAGTGTDAEAFNRWDWEGCLSQTPHFGRRNRNGCLSQTELPVSTPGTDASCNPDSTAALLATDYFPLSTYLLLMALVFATLASYHAEYSRNLNLK